MKKRKWMTVGESEEMLNEWYAATDRMIEKVNASATMTAAEKQQMRIDLLGALSDLISKIHKLETFDPNKVDQSE